ncbi:hypothetical protein DL96DRAFT_522660 [Flagelloscypha sp. PMI_526]|nr:hypothetical protein DL96DRAFT_522660 [Flagelloscypha sp. PMI_526]
MTQRATTLAFNSLTSFHGAQSSDMASSSLFVPNEIWEIIASSIPLMDLWSYRWICKAFYKIAYNAEMRTLDLSNNAPLAKQRWQCTQLEQDLDLAALVKTVCLTPKIMVEPYLPAFAWRKITHSVHALVPRGASHDSTVLRNLHNVKILKIIEKPFNDYFTEAPPIPRRCPQISAAFRLYSTHLTHVDLWINSKNGHRSYCSSREPLNLPKLRVLRLWNECPVSLTTTLINSIIQKSYELEELHLRTSFWNTQPLVLPNSLGDHSPCLRRLTWILPERFWPSYGILIPLLYFVRATLTDLTLNPLSYGLLDTTFVRKHSPINFDHLVSLRLRAALKTFSAKHLFCIPCNLRVLEIYMTLWPGEDEGPEQFLKLLSGWQSLESLTINFDRLDLNYILILAQYFPILRSLTIEFSNSPTTQLEKIQNLPVCITIKDICGLSSIFLETWALCDIGLVHEDPSSALEMTRCLASKIPSILSFYGEGGTFPITAPEPRATYPGIEKRFWEQ